MKKAREKSGIRESIVPLREYFNAAMEASMASEPRILGTSLFLDVRS